MRCFKRFTGPTE